MKIHGRTGEYSRRESTLYSTIMALCESVAFVGSFSKSDFLGFLTLTKADASLVNCVILQARWHSHIADINRREALDVLRAKVGKQVCKSNIAAFFMFVVSHNWNFVRTFSILAFHTHSCPLALWMPLSILLNFSVNLGPSSCRPALMSSTPLTTSPSGPTTLFSVSRLSLKIYLCRRTNM